MGAVSPWTPPPEPCQNPCCTTPSSGGCTRTVPCYWASFFWDNRTLSKRYLEQSAYTHAHTHNTALAVLAPQAKDFGPPTPLSYTVYAHIHSQTHSQSCTEGNATPPPVHLSGRLSQLLIPSARAQTQTCREVSQRLHQKPLWKKPLNHEPRMFSCIYLFYNIVCIYVCVKIWYIY